MLPRRYRLTRSDDFQRVFRTGRRVGGRLVVIHSLMTDDAHAPCVGFVVSKAVGNAVVRNLVKRRLRASMAQRLAELPKGSWWVVRALPAAATANFEDLTAGLDKGIARTVAPARL